MLVDEKNFVEKLQEYIEIVERHLKVLLIVKEEGPVGIIKLSNLTGLPPHKVRYSLRILEKNGLIKATTSGATATDKTEEFINHFQNILNNNLEKLAKLNEIIKSRGSSAGRACG
ncbi:MAG: hypothetical protein H5T44_03075 [Thermoplasmatales archaeon]|nr:hypothetical protein [Thermoplasmatales archaeon]